MQIECKLKRPGGSKIDIGGVTYHFRPENENDPHSPHVCDVKDKRHAQRFLGIPEGYCLPGDAPAPESPTPPAPPAANETSSGPVDTGNPAPSTETPLEAKSDDELREIIKEVTGSYPHPKTGREKLIAKIRGEDDGE